MAGGFYIWFMAAFFIGCGGILLLLTALFLIGHFMEKKRTGATHAFLELPTELRSPPPPPPIPATQHPSITHQPSATPHPSPTAPPTPQDPQKP